MSLKSFHVFFIVMVVLSCLSFGLYAFTRVGADRMGGLQVMGIISLLCGCGLAVYGGWFVLKKSGRLIV